MIRADFSLDEVPLLASLSPESRTELLRESALQEVGPATIIFQQGEIPTFQHVVLGGAVHLLGGPDRHRQVLIEAVDPPDLLTPAAVVTRAPYLLTARAQKSSQLLLIPADAFRNAVLDHPALAQQVIESLASQYRRMLRQIKNLKLRTAFERVGCYLIALAVRQKNAECVRLPYEKNLIASELGMTPESFSRALQALQKEGIEVQGDRILIEDLPHLASVSGIDPLIDDLDIANSLGRLEPKKKVASKANARERA